MSPSFLVRLLLLDFGLSETTVQGVCHGLDQLFSVMTSYTGLGRVPTFGLIVNGQTDCQVDPFERCHGAPSIPFDRSFCHCHPPVITIWKYRSHCVNYNY